MTENMTTWRDDEETILASDIWRVAKNLTPYASPEEELEAWRKTTRVLDSLVDMAGALMLDPLILALDDASTRAGEELERARERTERPAGELTEYEESVLSGLLARSDALGNGYTALLDGPDYRARAGDLEILEEMRRDAHEQFCRYRREVGLPDPETPAER